MATTFFDRLDPKTQEDLLPYRENLLNSGVLNGQFAVQAALPSPTELANGLGLKV